MEYGFMGRTGLRVSELCLGTQTFGWGADDPTAHALADGFVEAGGNFFDTSNIIFSWNEFLYALMLTNFDAITIPVLIAGQSNTRGIQWWFISALTLSAVIPVIIVGLLLERYITRGLTTGALSGQ